MARRPWVVMALWFVLALALRLIAPRWEDVTHDGDMDYLPYSLPSRQGEALLRRAFPDNKTRSQLAIVVERPGGLLTADDLHYVAELSDRLERLATDEPVVDVWSRATEIVGDKLTSKPSAQGQATVVVMSLGRDFMAAKNVPLMHRVWQIAQDSQREFGREDLRIGLTGSAAIGADMLASAAESIKNTEVATIFLVVVILLAVYRAPLLVVAPLATIGVALVVSLASLALLTKVGVATGWEWWNFKVFSTTKIFIVVILFGSGTDFCLFLIARFREELQNGRERQAAIAEAVVHVGEALVGSALTTVCGLGMMFFADFGKFSNSGPAIALCLLIALFACLTLTPALLSAFGGAVFWPFAPTPTKSGLAPLFPHSRAERFWLWSGQAITRWPGLTLAAGLLLLAPLACAGWNVDITYDFLAELAADRPSVVGTEIAKRYFAAGEMAPVTLLAVKPNARFDSPEGERSIALLTKSLYEVEGVASVRSIAEPLGDPPGYFQPFRSRGIKKLAARKHDRTQKSYLTREPTLFGDVARFDVISNYDPFSLAAMDFMNRLDDFLVRQTEEPESPWRGARFALSGASVGIRDLKAVTESDRVIIERLVVLAVLAVLLFVLRRPVICLFLVFSVLLSYYATMGATEWFFQTLHGDTYVGLDWKAPIFLFVILIAVGEDYNILLATRVFEEQARHGAKRGLELAVAKTGGIITSCGVIMAGTFISMTAGSLRAMTELGFALSLGVMIDTFLVRPVLAPAFIALLDRLKEPAPTEAAKSADPVAAHS